MRELPKTPVQGQDTRFIGIGRSFASPNFQGSVFFLCVCVLRGNVVSRATAQQMMVNVEHLIASLIKWLWVKNQWYHFGVGAPPI